MDHLRSEISANLMEFGILQVIMENRWQILNQVLMDRIDHPTSKARHYSHLRDLKIANESKILILMDQVRLWELSKN